MIIIRKKTNLSWQVSATAKSKNIIHGREFKSLHSQMSVGINIIVSMITLFAAFYFIGKHMGTIGGVAVGIIGCIVGLLVESWLFVIRGSRADKSALRRKQEKRQFSLSAEALLS